MDNEAGPLHADLPGCARRRGGEVELTHNWDRREDYDGGRNFGHLAYRVDDIYALAQRLARPA